MSTLTSYPSHDRKLIRKKGFWKGIILAHLIVFAGQMHAATTSSGALMEAIRKMDLEVKKALRTQSEPGLAVGIIYQDQILFLRGYGVRKMGTSQPVDPHTVFQLGSVSKPISATLVGILQKMNQISLYEPIDAALPIDFPSAGYHQQVKLWHLLSHTSGIPRYGFNQQIEAYKPRARILQSLENTPALAKPGEKFDYHNVVFSLIENVTEHKTEQDFSVLLQKELFNPLQMHQTSSDYGTLLRTKDKAWPHGLSKIKSKRKEKRRAIARYQFVPYKTYSQAYYERARAAAGINSTVADLLSFLKLQLGYKPELLERPTLRTFQSPYAMSPGVSLGFRRFFPKGRLKSYYGLGWRILDVNGIQVVYHGGWLKGFTNFLGFLPDYEVGIVILHHAESRLSTDLAMRFFKNVMQPVMPPPKRHLTRVASKKRTRGRH